LSKRGAQPGNRNAAKGIRYRAQLEYELREYEDLPNGVAKGMALRAIARQHVADALSPDASVRLTARAELANRLDGKPKETIDATFTNAVAAELSDAELLDIARGRSDGTADAATSEAEPTGVH
jgi:hypothetical protein